MIRKWLQKCIVCNCKWEIKSENPEAEDIIRASSLGCGHQGLFTLEEIIKGSKNDLPLPQ